MNLDSKVGRKESVWGNGYLATEFLDYGFPSLA